MLTTFHTRGGIPCVSIYISLPPIVPHSEPEDFLRARRPAMLGHDVHPIRYRQRQHDDHIQDDNRHENLPDVRVAVAAADFTDVHAVDAADESDGRKSGTSISYVFLARSRRVER